MLPRTARANASYPLTFANLPTGVYAVQTIPTGADSSFATATVTVSEDTDVVLEARRGVTVRGEVVLDAERELSFDAEDLQVIPMPIGFTRSPIAAAAQGRITGDRTFELSGLWGPHVVRLNSVPRGWTLKAVRVGNDDLTDRPIDFDTYSEEAGRLQVVLTDRLAELSGTVSNDSGRPAAECDVITFASEPEKWYALSRFVMKAKTDAAGRFSVSPLPPGEYLVAALDSTPRRWWNHEFYVDSLRSSATRIVVREGGRYSLEMKVRLSPRF